MVDPGELDVSRTPSVTLRVARMRLALLRFVREQPHATALVIALSLTVGVLLLQQPNSVSRCPRCDTLGSGGDAWARRSPRVFGEPAARPMSALQIDAAPGPPSMALSMAHVVVGVMTCRRFHRTRCRMQRETWLQRARRVVFFSDGDDAGAELEAPLVAHAFEPAPTERVFAGGNWRAVPILHAMAEAFFTADAQEVMRGRGEPLPRWAFMCDDDSFTFTSELLATLAKLDPDEPHYLGYAFIAAPHLEGIVPGVRQPLFANGGAGIAVSRAAMRAVLPHMAQCEREYRWNWPGDVRVAQCLLDVGVPVTWVHTFHAENPHVIIHKAKPPPGSVPVGLHLPPLSFHHVDLDTLHQLDRMHIVRTQAALPGLPPRPHFFDFAPFVFQPLAARHPTSGATLQIHLGYEILLNGGDPADGLGRLHKVGDFLATFAREEAAAEAGAHGGLSFVQEFTGGECRVGGALRGGHRASVRLWCGECSGEAWGEARAAGLSLCGFEVADCRVDALVAIAPSSCPRAQPLVRVGLDGGTVARHSDWCSTARFSRSGRRFAPAGAAPPCECSLASRRPT